MKDYQLFQDHFSESPFFSSSLGSKTTERPFSSSENATSSQSPSSSDDFPTFTLNKGNPKYVKKKKFYNKANSYMYRIGEHVKMGPKFTETVKGKLSVGAKIIQRGGRENIFKHIFTVTDGEKLLKASQCYLSTTAGPIAGILFISTEKVAFCSERPFISSSTSDGSLARTLYKVIIPTKKIKRANESENVEKPAQKYIEVVTDDNFEFWFMGFVRYEKAFLNLQKAISMCN